MSLKVVLRGHSFKPDKAYKNAQKGLAELHERYMEDPQSVHKVKQVGKKIVIQSMSWDKYLDLKFKR
ncbi:hypothetical protein [Leptospira idonii]|uniref:Uncharacterized protein n=1 Tax=Leptospira idonii TaxID=1193500 RepID=A0A4R9LYI9_9LEPT|nr:hypothetical protein [Leptospira idonii]TGN19393.1 hypothetical protein EHS15_08600 [Leptospira idonii]